MFRIICWLQEVWNDIKGGPKLLYPISGHNFVEEVPETKAIVQVLKCERCGYRSTAWRPLETATPK